MMANGPGDDIAMGQRRTEACYLVRRICVLVSLWMAFGSDRSSPGARASLRRYFSRPFLGGCVSSHEGYRSTRRFDLPFGSHAAPSICMYVYVFVQNQVYR